MLKSETVISSRNLLIPRPSLGKSGSGFLALNAAGEAARKCKAPQGRVTIVFTDVQDSTKLWESDQEAMSIAVKEHHKAMRTGIKRFSGFEVKTEGDAFMVAFQTSRDAVKWCLHMQETLINVDYPMPLLLQASARLEKDKYGAIIWRGLRVRMGIHTGTPESTLDPVTGRMDYYGPMVNMTARVSGQARGGQILVTKDTFDEIRHDLRSIGLPTINDAGLVDLRGISKSVRLYAVLPDKLAQRSFDIDNNPVAQIEYLQGLTKELNRDLENLDPGAHLMFDSVPARHQDLHVQPVVVDMTWLRQKLEGQSDSDRFASLQSALEGVASSEGQALFDKTAFTLCDEDVIETTMGALKVAATNVYDQLHLMMTSVANETAGTLQPYYVNLLGELQTSLQCIGICEEKMDAVRDGKENIEEQITRLEAQVAAYEEELRYYRTGNNLAPTSPMSPDESVSDAYPGASLGSSTETEVSVVMMQVEDALALHVKAPDIFDESTSLLQASVSRLMHRYGGERVNYGVEHVGPIGGKHIEPDGAEYERPAWVLATEYALVFNKADDAIFFSTDLQAQLLQVDWPERLLQHSNWRKEEQWCGLRLRCSVTCGLAPPPAVSPAGVRWYTGSAFQKASRLLAVASGGEVVASERVWTAFCERANAEELASAWHPTGKGWTVLPHPLAGRYGKCNSPKGRFLDVRFWISGAPTLPGDAQQLGYLTHELRMRELREEEVYHAVEELLKAKTGKAHGRFKSVEAVSASLEASLMRLHDPCDTAVAGPRKQSCDKPAVHPRKESLAPCIEVTPPNTSLTPDADGLPPRGAAGTRRERFMSMISSKLRLDGLDDVKAAAVTGQGATGTPRTARSNTPPGRARNWAEAGDMRALHGTVRVVCQLFKRFLAPPTPAEHMSGEQVIKAFAKKVLTDHPTRRDHPFREQFNAVVELALDADESDPAISAADAGRLSQSIAGLLARLFLTVKAYKQRQTVETNKVVLSTPPPAAPLVASRRPSAFPAMPGPAARLTPISVDLAQPQQQAKKPAPRVRAQVLSVTPPGGGGGPALKSITSPSNGRLVSSQGPRLGRAPPKAAGGGGGARRKRSKSASAGTSKAGDEDGLTVETDSASDGDPASSDRDSTTMTGSPISSLRKESAKRSK